MERETKQRSCNVVAFTVSADDGRVRVRLVDDRPEAIPEDPAALARLLAALDALCDTLSNAA
jgi:hypothetical protein